MTSYSATQVASARTLLFVPGNRPDRFAKAAAAGADGILLDLEDAVPPGAKESARQHVNRWRANGGQALVRINGITSPWHAQDLAELGDQPCAVVLPKTESPEDVADVLGQLPEGSCLVPVLETPAGILNSRAVCAAPGVVRVVFGNGDLSARLGTDHADHTALLHARSTLVLASAASRIAPPLDGVTTALDDTSALTRDAQHAAALGYTGKLCIHPRQIPTVNRVFTPTATQVQWARNVIDAAGDGGATVVDGQMIDKPMVDRAHRLLAQAR